MMPLLQVQVHWHTPASIAYIGPKVALGSEAQGCQWARRQKGTGTAGPLNHRRCTSTGPSSISVYAGARRRLAR